MTSTAYDFVVIGSGSAGAVVASRLSENGRHTVLCLEAGEKDETYLWSRPPAGVALMIDNPAVNWRYYSEPNETHGNRPIYVPRGKMLGGTSSINGMIYNRGQQRDFDNWARLGCQGWGYADILPYLKKIESTTVGSDEYRGRSGPVRVTEASKVSPFYDLFIQSAIAAGIPYNPDYSGATQEGVAMAQQTVHKGERQSTATQYLRPARGRPNLTILTGAEATSLIISGQHCEGVRYRRHGGVHEARARREVIVSGGTVNSPKLLELSGIGNPAVLQRHGIRAVQALPGVGENLREHYAASMRWRFNKPGISIAKKGRGWRLALEILRYAIFRTGFIAQGLGTMRIYARSSDELEHPDIMMAIAPFIMESGIKGQGRRMSSTEGFFTFTHMQHAESAGSIHIRSADPLAPPLINFRFLDTPADRKAAVGAVRCARKIVAAPPMCDNIAEELLPGAHIRRDEEIIEYIRNNGGITSHPVGTCRMGSDDMAVVDSRLRVRGIAGLRVADASVLPTTIAATNIPCMLVGEKCADMVLADAAA